MNINAGRQRMEYPQVVGGNHSDSEEMQLSYFPPKQVLHFRVFQPFDDLIRHLHSIPCRSGNFCFHLLPEPCLPVACGDFGTHLVPGFNVFVPVHLVLVE